MIEKMLVTTTPFFSLISLLDTVFKPLLYIEMLSKSKRCNQIKLKYFDYYFDRIYRNRKVILIEKKIYYKNVILFV